MHRYSEMGLEMQLDGWQQELKWKDQRIEELQAELAKFKALDLGKLSYYERNKERLKRMNADKRWCCKICNVEVSNVHKTGHLQSKSHLVKAAHAAGVEPDPALLIWGKGRRNYVHCQVCDMQINARTVAEHEKTEVHQERLAAQAAKE